MGDQQARREPGGAMDGGASAEGAANGESNGQSNGQCSHRSGESSAKYIGGVRKTAAKAVKAATSRRSRKGGSGRAGSAVGGGDGDDSSDATEVSALLLPCDAPGEEGGRSDALPPAASGSCGATLKLSSLLEDPEAPATGAADVVRCTTSSAPAEGSRDVLRTPGARAPPPAAPAPAAPADVDAWIVEL